METHLPPPPRRIHTPCAGSPGNAAIRVRYPIDLAHWLWHPDVPVDAFAVVQFSLDFELSVPTTLEFETTADQRFILSLNGDEFGRGPDRSELGGWSFHRYGIDLRAGTHRLEATVWWLTDEQRPTAQVTARPAFALVGIGQADALLSTGKANWQVRRLNKWSVLPKEKKLGYHVIGCRFAMHGDREPGQWTLPIVVQRGYDSLSGCLATPWRCEPSPLLEQSRILFTGGRIRAVQQDTSDYICADHADAAWQGLTSGNAVTIPAHSRMQILWDFEDYICGYTRLCLSGGAGSEISLEWSESLYSDENPSSRSPKGNRSECAGKYWLGFGDTVYHPGGEMSYESLWWRSGRWLRLVVTTGEEALVLQDARPLGTVYPFKRAWKFETDGDFMPMLEVCERGLRNCVHETFVDCPFFEQMQYVGDTRTQALTWLVATGDRRPVQRALELFDRSRWVNGFVAERCPTGQLQMSATYSLIQPLLLRDYAWWVDDPEFVRSLLPGTRSALEAALACIDEAGLPSKLPGWLFVDWVEHKDWQRGVPGGTSAGVRAPIALHLPVALSAMAEIESAFGEEIMAQRWRNWAAKIMQRIAETFWNSSRMLLADDAEATVWSEHAQALALDYSELPEEVKPALIQGLKTPTPDMAKASVYFSFHVHEALIKAGEEATVLERFEFWRQLVAQGFLTTVEAPEPARSDCHGWGAHPLYHCLTGLAGIRPAAPGFAKVSITPRMGGLNNITAQVPHPKGRISVELQREGAILHALIDSPVEGMLRWQQSELSFAAGETRVTVS